MPDIGTINSQKWQSRIITHIYGCPGYSMDNTLPELSQILKTENQNRTEVRLSSFLLFFLHFHFRTAACFRFCSTWSMRVWNGKRTGSASLKVTQLRYHPYGWYPSRKHRMKMAYFISDSNSMPEISSTWTSTKLNRKESVNPTEIFELKNTPRKKPSTILCQSVWNDGCTCTHSQNRNSNEKHHEKDKRNPCQSN